MENFKNWGKKALKVGVLAGALFVSKKTEGKNTESDSTLLKNKTTLEDSTKKNLEQGKGNIAVYTTSKTKEGGITPTGLNNSFLNNKYGVKPEDLDSVAKYFGFRNTNEKDFQEDMINYAQTNDPALINKVLQEFGSTNYGEKNNIKNYRQLMDGLLGGRDAFIIGNLKKKIEENKIKKTEQTVEEHVSKTETKEEIQEKIFKLDGIDKLYVLFDVSPSMRMTKDTLAKDLLNNKSDLPVEFSGFTDKVEYTNNTTSLKEASMILRDAKLVDQDKELGVNVLLEKMTSLEEEGKKLIVICTDEELQDVSKDELLKIKELSKDKNTQVQFTIMLRGIVSNVSVDDLLKIYEQRYEKAVEEKVNIYNKQISLREKYIKIYKDELEKTSEKKKLKELRTNLENEEKELLELKVNLLKAKQVNINNFNLKEDSLAKN